jgi:hypothetical protein
VTGPTPPARDGQDPEALLADRYLDDLLAAADRRADDAPADAGLDPELRVAARALRRALVRIHPSFRFEERLAATLAAAADEQAAARARTTGTAEPLAAGRSPDAPPRLVLLRAGGLARSDEADPHGAYRRPLLVGGALTSAALSLVGVAWVAWRATRPGARGGAGAAASLVHAGGFAGDAAAALAGDLGGPA